MTTKEKILELEMENAELRDRLDELGEMLPAQGESEDIQNTIKEAMDKERGL
jgi:regulator of replication initiation timing